SDRVSCLGTVSLDRPDELVELMRDGRLRGVEVAASVDGEYLGAPRYRPFWAAVEETGALVLVHPTTRGLGVAALEQHYLWNTVGNPLETTIAAAHLLLEGVLDEHPGVNIVLAHGGGAITALRGRLEHHQRLRPDGRDVLGGLRRFFYDTVVLDAEVLRALVDFAGADRVVVGSDYPFDMGDGRPAEVVRALGLPAADEERILSGNARRLLGQVAG
ncbi:MAG: amidohydrolase family protein, partial [Gaiellaceae bacterium]